MKLERTKGKKVNTEELVKLKEMLRKLLKLLEEVSNGDWQMQSLEWQRQARALKAEILVLLN